MNKKTKDKLKDEVITFLADKGLDHVEKRRVLLNAYNKLTKIIKAGNTGIQEEKVDNKESDSNCPKTEESIAFED